MTLQDELEELLDDMERGGSNKEEMLTALEDIIGDHAIAFEAYDDWLSNKNPKNEEASIGEIESEFIDLWLEAVPFEDAFERLEKKYGFTQTELKRILKDAIDEIEASDAGFDRHHDVKAWRAENPEAAARFDKFR